VTEIWAKLQHAGREVLRKDVSAGERALRLGQRLVSAGRLDPRVSIKRNVVVELTKPPMEIRAMRDLVVRRAGEMELDTVASLSDTPPELMRARVTSGDRPYVGVLGDKIVCKTWFHQGPAPFEEDRDTLVSWTLEPSAFWSYDAAAAPDAMSTGFFIKVFVVGLRELFETDKATRVLGCIRDTNGPSLKVHDRLGFTRVGILTTVNLPGIKWVHWQGRGGPRRQWVWRANSLAFSVPI
jgi:hypothetical protein